MPIRYAATAQEEIFRLAALFFWRIIRQPGQMTGRSSLKQPESSSLARSKQTKPAWTARRRTSTSTGSSAPDAALPARPWWRASGIVKPVRLSPVLSASPSRGRRRAFVEDFTVEGAPTKHQPEGASKRFSRAPATPRHHRPAPLSWLELLDRGSNGQGRWPFAVGRHA